jgi:hypothetical protein
MVMAQHFDASVEFSTESKNAVAALEDLMAVPRAAARGNVSRLPSSTPTLCATLRSKCNNWVLLAPQSYGAAK